MRRVRYTCNITLLRCIRKIQIIVGDQKDHLPLWEVHIKKKWGLVVAKKFPDVIEMRVNFTGRQNKR